MDKQKPWVNDLSISVKFKIPAQSKQRTNQKLSYQQKIGWRTKEKSLKNSN